MSTKISMNKSVITNLQKIQLVNVVQSATLLNATMHNCITARDQQKKLSRVFEKERTRIRDVPSSIKQPMEEACAELQAAAQCTRYVRRRRRARVRRSKMQPHSTRLPGHLIQLDGHGCTPLLKPGNTPLHHTHPK